MTNDVINDSNETTSKMLELMGPVMGHRYHKLCFRCHACERLLDFKNYRTNLIDLNDREIYCTAHNPRNGAFNDNIYGYNARSKSPGNVATTNDGVNESLYKSSLNFFYPPPAYFESNLTNLLIFPYMFIFRFVSSPFYFTFLCHVMSYL